MNEVERYLNRATRGLWGRRRREVREELEVHLFERITAHRIAGLNEGDAVEKVLREMGEPGEVSSGMMRLYTAPWVAGSGVFLAAICTLIIVTFSSGLAQTLQVTQIFPSPTCLETPDTDETVCRGFGVWTTIEALQEVLKPQGVQVSKRGDTVSLRFEDGISSAASPFPFPHSDEKGEALSNVYQPEPNYFLVWDFLESLANDSFLSVRIEGWNDLTVHVNDTSFVLSGKQRAGSRDLYQSYLASIVFNPNQILARSQQANPYNTVITYAGDKKPNALTLQVSGSKTHAIYGVLVPQPIGKFSDLELGTDYVLAADVAQANTEGSIDFLLSPNTPLRFLESFSGELQEGTAVLVQLSGESKPNGLGFSYEVVQPEQIQEVN